MLSGIMQREMVAIIENINIEPLKIQIKKANRRMKEAQKQKENWWKKLPKKRRKLKAL